MLGCHIYTLHGKVTELLVGLTDHDMMRLLQEIQAERARIAFSKQKNQKVRAD